MRPFVATSDNLYIITSGVKSAKDYNNVVSVFMKEFAGTGKTADLLFFRVAFG